MNVDYKRLSLLGKKILEVGAKNPDFDDDLREWLTHVSAFEKDVHPTLLRYWGNALVQLLMNGKTKPLEAADAQFVASFVKASCTVAPDIFVSDRPLGDTTFPSWPGEKHLYKNMEALIGLLNVPYTRVVLVNLFETQQWSVNEFKTLLVKSDECIQGQAISFAKFHSSLWGRMLACIPTLLCSSSWVPPHEHEQLYAPAWQFAVLSSSHEPSVVSDLNRRRLQACANGLVNSTSEKLNCLFRNPKATSQDVELLFPFESEGLGLRSNLIKILHIHANRNAVRAWDAMATLFTKEYPALAQLVESHMLLFPDGKGADAVLDAWRCVLEGRELTPAPQFDIGHFL